MNHFSWLVFRNQNIIIISINCHTLLAIKIYENFYTLLNNVNTVDRYYSSIGALKVEIVKFEEKKPHRYELRRDSETDFQRIHSKEWMNERSDTFVQTSIIIHSMTKWRYYLVTYGLALFIFTKHFSHQLVINTMHVASRHSSILTKVLVYIFLYAKL